MSHNMIHAKYIKDYKIELFYDNGKSGIVDFEKYARKGGIFSNLKDVNFFRDFNIDLEVGLITWGDEIAVAAGTLYTEAINEQVPEWIKKETVSR